MGVTAAITIAAVATGYTAYSSNQEAHAATNAHTAMAQHEMEVTDQLEAAQQQTTDTSNNQAQQTATAQARVRAISNPDGDTIMTSPLGYAGGNSGSGGPGGSGGASLGGNPAMPTTIASPYRPPAAPTNSNPDQSGSNDNAAYRINSGKNNVGG